MEYKDLKTDLERTHDKWRTIVYDGKIIEELELTNGWKLIKKEIQNMISSYEQQIFDGSCVSDHPKYMNLLGARNALSSMLTAFESKKERGVQAAGSLKQSEADNAEELQRLGGL